MLKIKSTAEILMSDIILDYLIKETDSQGIKSEPNNFKILIQNKNNQEVEVGADKIKVIFNKE